MAFWDNVAVELDYLGMTNKALAEKVGFAASNISKGVRTDSSPSADTAVKIAQVLGVSVEYLVNGSESSTPAEKLDTHLYHKYAGLIAELESLPEHERGAIAELISSLSRAASANNSSRTEAAAPSPLPLH